MTDRGRPSTDAVLRRGLAGDGDERRLTLAADFQGLPDTAHGGTVLAAFDAMAGLGGARSVSGLYRRRVPLDTPLQLAIRRDGGAVGFRLSDGGTLLVDGAVEIGDARATPTEGAPAPLADAVPLPVSSTCFACGTDNRLGLRVRLALDDATVRGVWTPRETLRAADGTLAPVAVTTLLDEAAFWLGAAASGESGMTTELRLALHGPVPFGRRLTVAGARAAVRARPDDPRYWETEVAVWDEGGTAVASAHITFVAVRGAARKLVAGLLAANPPEILRRVFPAYTR